MVSIRPAEESDEASVYELVSALMAVSLDRKSFHDVFVQNIRDDKEFSGGCTTILRAGGVQANACKFHKKKIKRLQEDPLHVGGWLSGELHGKKLTRITKRYRLIFTPDETEKVVYLNGIDHRKHVY